jgi:K+-sensing histidine kinase KdpD
MFAPFQRLGGTGTTTGVGLGLTVSHGLTETMRSSQAGKYRRAGGFSGRVRAA